MRAVRGRTPILRAILVALACALAAGSGLAGRARVNRAAFPHERHAGLFPLCTSCHMGVEQTGAAVYPDADRCRACHDGERLERVEYDAGRPRPSNLRYSHERHGRALASKGQAVGCERCHQREDATDRMAVARPTPDRCMGCHAAAPATHPDAPVRCLQCHVPLAESELPLERIAQFQKPADHDTDAFLSGHAPAAGDASCTICHARESCERCHRNADSVDAITALPRDPRVAALAAGRAAEYPVPDGHRRPAWSREHAAAAEAGTATCSNCHTRTDCTACHGSPAADDRIRALPVDPGAGRSDAQPIARRVHASGFGGQHGAAAGSSDSCAACHDRSFCTDCHDAPGGGYHPANFIARHGPEAYGTASECSACHTTETFCRGCHQGNGVAAAGRTQIAYHSTRSLWLLGHGQAARQTLESCAGCHAQSDCTRCHAATGGWRVNPHGPGFDADRLEQRNAIMCTRCHVRARSGG